MPVGGSNVSILIHEDAHHFTPTLSHLRLAPGFFLEGPPSSKALISFHGHEQVTTNPFRPPFSDSRDLFFLQRFFLMNSDSCASRKLYSLKLRFNAPPTLNYSFERPPGFWIFANVSCSRPLCTNLTLFLFCPRDFPPQLFVPFPFFLSFPCFHRLGSHRFFAYFPSFFQV